jgi:hypothetical protein
MVRDLEMLEGPNLKTNILKISDKICKIEGNINMQGKPNSFTYEKKGKLKKCAIST